MKKLPRNRNEATFLSVSLITTVSVQNDSCNVRLMVRLPQNFIVGRLLL